MRFYLPARLKSMISPALQQTGNSHGHWEAAAALTHQLLLLPQGEKFLFRTFPFILTTVHQAPLSFCFKIDIASIRILPERVSWNAVHPKNFLRITWKSVKPHSQKSLPLRVRAESHIQTLTSVERKSDDAGIYCAH